MNEMDTVVGLFPGQGSYRQGCFAGAWREGNEVVREVYTAVDDAARTVLGREVTPVVFADRPPTGGELLTEAPDVLQLAIYAQSVCAHRLLQRAGATASWLVGHSMGEIAALVCGGAYSVADGAAILCHRIAALRDHDHSGGRMLAVRADTARVAAILDLVGDPDTVTAVDNGPGQTVVSGPRTGVDAVAAIGAAIGVSCTVLKSPHPFHNRLLATAAERFEQEAKRYEQCRLTAPVYSPILGRFYRDGDTIAQLLAHHLLMPVEFGPSLARLYRDGARLFVELGPGGALGRLVSEAHPAATVLDAFVGSDEVAAVFQAAAYLRPTPAAREGAGHAALFRMPAGVEPGDPDDRGRKRAAVSAPRSPLAIAAVPEQKWPPAATAAPDTAVAEDTPVTVTDTSPVAPAADTRAPVEETDAPSGSEQDRDALLQEVRSLYAEALEYPEEVLTEDAVFERDLGIDSVQQTELIVSLRRKYGLNGEDRGMQLRQHDTLGKVTDYVHSRRAVSTGVRQETGHHS